MKETIIFDFDGTIADTFPVIVRIFYHLTKRTDPFTYDEEERLRSLSLLSVAAELRIPLWRVPFLLVRGRRMMRQHMRQIEPVKGVPKTIKALHERGHNLMVISSNSSENIREFLRLHELDDRIFSNIYGGIGLWSKGRSLQRLARRSAFDVQHTWYVGDETRDIVAAKAAGVKSAAVAWGYNSVAALKEQQPDAIVSEPQDLLAIIPEKAT
jgi:phosphoglycolate phosphatase